MNEIINAVRIMNEKEMQAIKIKSREETKYKIEAMTKLEGLR